MVRRIIMLAAVAAVSCGQPAQPVPGSPAPVGSAGLSVPIDGDRASGRQAFLDLKCSACHQVPSEPGFPDPVSENPGPGLDGRIAKGDPSYLISAILLPSHSMSIQTSEGIKSHLTGTLSPMGDFSRVMTVRQLVDLHAFLASLP